MDLDAALDEIERGIDRDVGVSYRLKRAAFDAARDADQKSKRGDASRATKALSEYDTKVVKGMSDAYGFALRDYRNKLDELTKDLRETLDDYGRTLSTTKPPLDENDCRDFLKI